MKSNGDNFRHVVYLGPDMRGKGGIATVMGQYRDAMTGFRHGSVNSCHGKLRGMLNLGWTVAKMVAYRLSGSRILHIHYAGQGSWKRENMLASIGRAIGYRTVMHCHCNLIELSDNQGREQVIDKLSRAHAHIVLASSYRDFAVGQLGLKNVTVVPNFVDSQRRGGDRTSGVPTFLFMGLLTEAKGFFDLLAACGNLVRQGRHFRLIVGGTGDRERVDREISAKGLGGFVELRGWIGGEEKDRVINESDVLVLPSYSEGMPMVVIEALQAGCAVIGTAVGAIPDMVTDGETGFVVPVGDVDALTKAMSALIDDPAKLRQFKTAATVAGEMFTPARVLPILSGIYKDIHANKGQ